MDACVDRNSAPVTAIRIGGVDLVADLSGALYHEASRTLLVADLHLEKGSAYAARGVLLPPWDTAATLAKLARLALAHAPRAIVALGDSFHDARAGERIADADRSALRALQAGRSFIWISGNHDPAPPRDVGGEAVQSLEFEGLVLRHEPSPAPQAGEIAGHLHPVARVVARSGGVRRRCFAASETRCIMPAFGAYAGGLNVRDRAFHALFPDGEFVAHVLGREAIYAVGPASCAAES